jgi:hypothetical protein
MQIQDLAKAYQTKPDEELLQLAMNSEQLTLEAHTILRSELARRKIHVHLLSPTEEDRGIEQRRANRSQLAGEFVEEVLRVYRDQFWLFIKLIAPAVVLGYVAVFIGRSEGQEIARGLPRGLAMLSHKTEILEIWFANFTAYLVSWVSFSFSFGAICSAVDRIRAGVIPSFADSFSAVRERLGSFLRLSLLLFFVMLVAIAGAELASGCIFWALHQGQVHPSRFAIHVVSFGAVGVALLLLSRFGLAIPAFILDDCRVGQSMFRSDELTEGEWLKLAVLLAKSLVGGYVAGMCPFWLASFIPANAQLPAWFPWILTGASIAAVTVVEPTMFIGFVLLYSKKANISPSSSEALARQLAEYPHCAH